METNAMQSTGRLQKQRLVFIDLVVAAFMVESSINNVQRIAMSDGGWRMADGKATCTVAS
jgi:hypothetical protein